MKTPISSLSDHLPLSARRIVVWAGERCQYGTPIGMVEGTADGKILVRDFAKRTHYELSVEEARVASEALRNAAIGVKEQQKRASGYYRITAHRAGGILYVRTHDQTRPMRLSALRRPRPCAACFAEVMSLYVAADVVKEHGWRVQHVEVCESCVERLVLEGERVAEDPVREIGGGQ